jgi:hypothetical protein
VLRIKRTLDGAEIDKIVADVAARKAMAIEHRRRADWRERELAGQEHGQTIPLPDSRSQASHH